MWHRIVSKVSSGFPHIFFVRQPGLPVLHIVLHVLCVMTEFFSSPLQIFGKGFAIFRVKTLSTTGAPNSGFYCVSIQPLSALYKALYGDYCQRGGRPSSWQLIKSCVNTEEKSHLSVRFLFWPYLAVSNTPYLGSDVTFWQTKWRSRGWFVIVFQREFTPFTIKITSMEL